jgi:SAM-dependent methyltransferase
LNTASNRHHDGSPSDWVRRYAHLIAPGARVLDLAAGRGRHARYLAARGAEVLAVDRDAEALAEIADLPRVTTQVADLESAPWPFGATRFAAIVVVHYLYRALLPTIRGALDDGGVLLYETFARGNEAYGRPRNPDFLLAPGELLDWAARAPALTVLAFEQGLERRGDDAVVIQRLAAVAPGYPWPPTLTPAGGKGGNGGRIG